MINAFNLGQNIKYYIDEKFNGNIKKFADEINYDYIKLTQIIDGRKLISPTELIKIANDLDINPMILVEDNVKVVKIKDGFDDDFNMDMILNIMDDYIEIIERSENE